MTSFTFRRQLKFPPADRRLSALRACAVLVLYLLGSMNVTADSNPLPSQVAARERAFAKTMVDRDLQAFSQFLSSEAVFFGDARTLRGRQAVVDGWAPFFAGPQAPFSWEPDQVEVLDSGLLALSTGLVKDPAGKVVGRFNSIWRLESPGVWRVVFDKGSPAEAQR